MISGLVNFPNPVFSLQIHVPHSLSLVSKERVKDKESPFMFLFRAVFSTQRWFVLCPL